MKKFLMNLLILLAIANLSASAQKAKTVSPEDQKAIVALFKGVDPKMYKLQFNNGKEMYGSRKVNMTELKQAQTVRNPGSANGYVVLAYKDDGIMIVFAATGKKVEDILGAEKAAKLNAITSKYAR